MTSISFIYFTGLYTLSELYIGTVQMKYYNTGVMVI